VVEAELKVGWTTSVKDPDNSGFYVLAEIETAVVPRGEGRESALEVHATFELHYSLPEGFQTTAQQLDEFARFNGVFNVWPYWREVVQNSFVRMGFPPVTLPVYRLDLVKHEKLQ